MAKSRHFPVSALTGQGIDQFKARFEEILDSERASLTEDAILVNARHAEALGNASESIAAALVKIETSESPELTVSDLRVGLNSLGEITGKIDNERMLDKLFASFCIGK